MLQESFIVVFWMRNSVFCDDSILRFAKWKEKQWPNSLFKCSKLACPLFFSKCLAKNVRFQKQTRNCKNSTIDL